MDTEENAFPCKDMISVADHYEEVIHKVIKIRKTEYELENELFEKCTKIINTYNFDNPIFWTIIYVCLIIIGISLIFVFKGTLKLFIGLTLFGIICGGFARNKKSRNFLAKIITVNKAEGGIFRLCGQVKAALWPLPEHKVHQGVGRSPQGERFFPLLPDF